MSNSRGPGRAGGSRTRLRRGQTLVEFALILPIFLLLVTGLLQFGLLLSGQIAFVNGVREAARFGSVLQTADPTQADANGVAVNARLHEVLAAGLPGYDAGQLVGVQTCYEGYANPPAGSSPPVYSVRLTVSGTYRHQLLLPIIAPILDSLDGHAGGDLRLTASEVFRVENPPLDTNQLSTPRCVSS